MEMILGEIRNFSFNIVPKGWAKCAGQTMSIAQNTALFSLLGTTYGGNGVTTFNLPNLQGLTGLSQGQGYTLGQQAGYEFVSLTPNQLPAHNHFVIAHETMGNNVLNNIDDYPAQMSVFVSNPQSQQYAVNGFTDNHANMIPLANDTIGSTGGGQPHENRQPFLVINVCIAITGVFPSRS